MSDGDGGDAAPAEVVFAHSATQTQLCLSLSELCCCASACCFTPFVVFLLFICELMKDDEYMM